MPSQLPLELAIALLAVVVGGLFFWLGRFTASRKGRLGELEAELETTREARGQLQEELDGYRGRVADHFAETSERLRDLTLQYRSVYDHLAEGAGELCPDGFEKLEGGLGLDALPEDAAPGEQAEPLEDLGPVDESAEPREEAR